MLIRTSQLSYRRRQFLIVGDGTKHVTEPSKKSLNVFGTARVPSMLISGFNEYENVVDTPTPPRAIPYIKICATDLEGN